MWIIRNWWFRKYNEKITEFIFFFDNIRMTNSLSRCASLKELPIRSKHPSRLKSLVNRFKEKNTTQNVTVKIDSETCRVKILTKDEKEGESTPDSQASLKPAFNELDPDAKDEIINKLSPEYRVRLSAVDHSLKIQVNINEDVDVQVLKNTKLREAIDRRSPVEIVQALIKAGADASQTITHLNGQTKSLLEFAIDRSSPEEVILLIKNSVG